MINMAKSKAAQIFNAVSWYNSLDSLQKDNLCKRYFPFNNWRELSDDEIIRIHKEEYKEPSKIEFVISFGTDQTAFIDGILDSMVAKEEVLEYTTAPVLNSDELVEYTIKFSNMSGIYFFGYNQANAINDQNRMFRHMGGSL